MLRSPLNSLLILALAIAPTLAAAAPGSTRAGSANLRELVDTNNLEQVAESAGISEVNMANLIVPDALIGPSKFEKTVELSDSFGDSKFGAAYSVGGRIEMQREDGDEILDAEAWLEISATLFSKTRDIVDVRAVGHTEVDQASEFTIDATVMGSTIFSAEWDGNVNHSDRDTMTFFSAEYDTVVWFIPVHVEASLTGYVGYHLDLQLGLDGLEATVEPFAGAEVTASAGAGISIANAGIYGDLTIIDIALPVSAGVDADMNNQSMSVDWYLTADLEITTLSGEFGLYAEAFGARKEKALADWDGVSRSYSLIDESGTFTFGRTPQLPN